MKCPRDDHELEPKKYEGDVEIDVCPECLGQFLDKGELERIQTLTERTHPRSSPPTQRAREAFEQVRQMAAGPIACPKCGSEMITRPYGHGSQTVIEVCSEDCGLWLDAGELEALEQFYEQRQKEAEEELPLHFRIWLGVTELLHRKR